MFNSLQSKDKFKIFLIIKLKFLFKQTRCFFNGIANEKDVIFSLTSYSILFVDTSVFSFIIYTYMCVSFIRWNVFPL